MPNRGHSSCPGRHARVRKRCNEFVDFDCCSHLTRVSKDAGSWADGVFSVETKMRNWIHQQRLTLTFYLIMFLSMRLVCNLLRGRAENCGRRRLYELRLMNCMLCCRSFVSPSQTHGALAGEIWSYAELLWRNLGAAGHPTNCGEISPNFIRTN